MNLDKLCTNCMKEMPDGAKFCPFCGGSSSYVIRRHHISPKTTLKEKYLVGNVLSEDGDSITYIALDTSTETKVQIREFYPQDAFSRDNTESSKVTVKEDTDVSERKEAFETATKQDANYIEAFSENETEYAVLKDVSIDTADEASADADESSAEKTPESSDAKKTTKSGNTKKKNSKNNGRNIALIVVAIAFVIIIGILGFTLASSSNKNDSAENEQQTESDEIAEFYDYIKLAVVDKNRPVDDEVQAAAGDDAQAAEEAATSEGAYEETWDDNTLESIGDLKDYLYREYGTTSLGSALKADDYYGRILTMDQRDYDDDGTNELLVILCDYDNSLIFQMYDGANGRVAKEPSASFAYNYITNTKGGSKMRILYYRNTSDANDESDSMRMKNLGWLIVVENQNPLEYGSFKYDGTSFSAVTIGSGESLRTDLEKNEGLIYSDKAWRKVVSTKETRCFDAYINTERNLLLKITNASGKTTIELP